MHHSRNNALFYLIAVKLNKASLFAPHREEGAQVGLWGVAVECVRGQ